ncbi:MAG: septum formation initiator family protein [FCB group bacterium]|nr:septum formation initiator family protein [FCB group bacterium]
MKGSRTKRNGSFFIRLVENNYVFGFMLFFIIVGTLVAYLYIRNDLNAVNARNLALHNSCSRMYQESIFLESEVNELKRPGRIQRIAREELGMVNSRPQADAIIVKKGT